MIIPLYPRPMPQRPGMREQEDIQPAGGPRIIRNVTQPTLTAFLPEDKDATGAAVIVAPGSAFMMLAFDTEGTMVARRLCERGIAAFVLKYRLGRTSEDTAGFMREMAERVSRYIELKRSVAPTQPCSAVFDGRSSAINDAAEAIRLVRARASEWELDPKRIGFLGFSAGGILATEVATGEPSGRPDFAGVIYGALEGTVPSDAPPAFIAAAADDPIEGVSSSLPLFEAWGAAGGSAELHVYERGGHGFGMPPQGTSSDRWFEDFIAWMDSRALTKAAAPGDRQTQ